MNKKLRFHNELLITLSAMLSAAFLAGCAGPSAGSGKTSEKTAEKRASEKAARTPYGSLTADAASYLTGLMEQDQLPGIRRRDHGTLMSAPTPLSEGEVSYPASVSFHVAKDGDASVYNYTLVKQNAAAPWQLAKAAREDKSGHVLEELLAP
jgi:hypothetical protein